MEEQKNEMFFPSVGSFCFIKVLELWILGTPDPQDCNSFLLNASFLYVQVPFETGFTVKLYYMLM